MRIRFLIKMSIKYKLYVDNKVELS
jgi:hypothetical protein